MGDVVVTAPKNFEYGMYKGLRAWISEGDAADEPWSGEEWHFYLGGPRPKVEPGDRVYIVCDGKLRGYAPLVRLENYPGGVNENGEYEGGGYALVRHGGAVAVTIDEPIKGFRGFRYRWWKVEDEKPFPGWQTD